MRGLFEDESAGWFTEGALLNLMPVTCWSFSIIFLFFEGDDLGVGVFSSFWILEPLLLRLTTAIYQVPNFAKRGKVEKVTAVDKERMGRAVLNR